MRKIIYSIIFIFVLSSCQSEPKTFEEEGGLILNCKVVDLKEDAYYLVDILEKRFKFLDKELKTEITFYLRDSSLQIKIPAMHDPALGKMVKSGSVLVCEYYLASDILSNYEFNTYIDSIGTKSSNTEFDNVDPVYILTNTDKANLRSTLSKMHLMKKELTLPNDIELAYRTSRHSELFNIFALKKNQQSIDVRKEMKKAELEKDENRDYNFVLISFKDTGAQKFSELTATNIGNALAFICDNEMISSPTVQSKVNGQAAVISGDTNLGNRITHAILNTPLIKSHIKIESIEDVDKQGKSSKRPNEVGEFINIVTII